MTTEEPPHSGGFSIPLGSLLMAGVIMAGLGVNNLLFRPHMHDVGIGMLFGSVATVGLALAFGYYQRQKNL